MSDDSTKQLVGTIGGFVSAAIFWADAVIANANLLNHLERRRAQRRGTDRLPMLHDTRLLFYFLAVCCSVGYCGSALLQLMVYPPIETNSPQSDLLDCVMVAVMLSMCAMMFFTVSDGVDRVQRLTASSSPGGVPSLGPGKANHSSASQVSSVLPHISAADKKRGGSFAGVVSVGDERNNNKAKRKKDYRTRTAAQDKDVVARFYAERGENSDISMQNGSMAATLTNTNTTLATADTTTTVERERRESQLSATGEQQQQQQQPQENSRVNLMRASRGSGTFKHSSSEDDDDDLDASSVQTGSFLEGYESEEWGTGFQQMNANQQQQQQYDYLAATGGSAAGGGAVNHSNSGRLSSTSATGGGEQPSDLLDDENTECLDWVRTNRCAVTMASIMTFYGSTTVVDFVYMQITGDFVSFGAYGSCIVSFCFGIMACIGGYRCISVYQGLSESAAPAAETLRLLASIFFILALFLILRAVLVFMPIQNAIGATLLPASLFLVDALSILFLLLRVPKTK